MVAGRTHTYQQKGLGKREKRKAGVNDGLIDVYSIYRFEETKNNHFFSGRFLTLPTQFKIPTKLV